MAGSPFPYSRQTGTATTSAATVTLTQGTHWDSECSGYFFTNSGTSPILVGIGENPTAAAGEVYVAAQSTVDIGCSPDSSIRVISVGGSSTYSLKGHR